MAKLSDMLTKKMQAKGVDDWGASQALDINILSLRKILADKSAPNSRSIGKYAKFLGITPEQVVATSAPRGGGKPGKSAGAAAKNEKKYKYQGARGPGRPKLPGVAKGTIRLLRASLKSIMRRVEKMGKVIDRIN